ncbi:MAG: type II toxin-antitoxin system prevent-host-death family antitoxin [Acidobacteria bacterium]|nr:type II toxin-antitoxin system prevent-host-death family antitoxin [Acidobacteriota bacterium]
MRNPMKTVTWPKKAARLQFSDMIREVMEGARVVITERGKPVVDVTPHMEPDLPLRPRCRPRRVTLRPGETTLADELAALRGDR